MTAERDEVELAPDRNSYAVKNMATASGGTAVDVLRNVPSIEVDGSNKVSLRGNENVVVQINGRSSPLRGEQLGNFLAQLPASTVARVEVATNPSAKNDLEGTAGIINIVLTQQTEQGLSGGMTAGTGSTGLVNASGNIGKQVGPWTLFTSYNLYRDNRPMSGSSDRSYLTAQPAAFLVSESDGSIRPRSQNLTLRTEYKLAEHDALSADAMVSGGNFSRSNTAYFSDLNAARSVVGLFNQYTVASSRNVTQDYVVAYRRTGGPQVTTFSTEARFTHNHSTNDNLLSSAVVQPGPTRGALTTPRERDVTTNGMPSFILQSDLTRPFASTHTKLESGLKATSRSTSSDFTAAYADAASGIYVPSAARANAFDYSERIGAVYGVLSQQVKRVDLQAGLRLEQAKTRLDVPAALGLGTLGSYDRSYASAFPSALISYNVSAAQQLKISYSRRITRPDPGQLNPIVFQEDQRSRYHGNPTLSPEYTDAYEAGLQQSTSWGSLQLAPYLRRTAHAVRFIRTVDSAGISDATFANVASTQSYGSDLNVTVRHGALTLFGGGSAYHYASDAGNLGLGNGFSTSTFGWSVRANASAKLSPATDVQLFANYRAPMATEGGSQTAFVFTNLALRQKLWGDKGGVTLRISDPFNLTKFGFKTNDGRVLESSVRRFGMRGVFVTFNRSFGQQLKLRPRPQEAEPTGGVPTPGTPGG